MVGVHTCWDPFAFQVRTLLLRPLVAYDDALLTIVTPGRSLTFSTLVPTGNGEVIFI